MATKITRATASIFAGGLSAGSQQVEQFSSKTATGTPNYAATGDPVALQALAGWANGWVAAIDAGTKAPYVQDRNAVDYVLSRQIAYLLQMGLAEWDAATTYYVGSVVQNDGQWFVSLIDNNAGNEPPGSGSNTNWLLWTPPVLTPSGSMPAGTIPVVSDAATVGPDGSQQVEAGLLSEDGTNVIIGGVAGTNGLKFPDLTVQRSAASPISSRQVYGSGGARAFNATYTNGTKPRYVQAWSTDISGTDITQILTAKITAGAAGPTYPITVDFHQLYTGGPTSSDVNGNVKVGFWVLPGETYTIIAGGSAVFGGWVECQ